MTVEEIIAELRAMSSEKYRENVVKLGIPAEASIGVATGDIRKLAKQLPRSNDLAWQLWRSGYHEAQLLAVLVFDPKQCSIADAQQLMADVGSWDLCDHLCKNLIVKIADFEQLIPKWSASSAMYLKRAAFTLIATRAVHDKQLDNETIRFYLCLILEQANDERMHVKKAISWALCELGKRSMLFKEWALNVADELIDNGDKEAAWVGRDARKELEQLVQVPGRSRLIRADSKMGKEVI